MAETKEADVEEAEVEAEATPEPEKGAETTDPKAAADATLAEAKKLADEARERERNATEALRAASDRGREAREEREAAKRELAEAKAAAADTQRMVREMENGLTVLANADPDSPTARMIQSARSRAGGNGNSASAGAPDSETKAQLEALRAEVAKQSQAIAGQQYREAIAAVDEQATAAWRNRHAPALNGVIEEKAFVAKVRRAVASDPVVNQTGTDEQTVRKRIDEIATETAAEIEGYGKNYHSRWKEQKRKQREEAPPTGRESAPGASSREEKRVRFNPNDPSDWERYKQRIGARGD